MATQKRKPKAKPKRKAKTLDRFKLIIIDISENGLSMRDAVLKHMNFRTFYQLLQDDEEKVKQYARATEIRADKMADEMLNIADTTVEGIKTKTTDKGIEVISGDMVEHRRLQVETRKWLLAKMNPKKYGDKLQLDNKINIEAREAFKALFPTQDEIDAAG